jgi:dihydrofolate synthase/folylpolyglutamate synthase
MSDRVLDPVLASADELIEQLMGLHPKGYDLSLDRILLLLEKLGNPHRKLPPVIHVAGTNGKGSFTAFARALLEAEGYPVHVHTSPHLVSWHERFRIAAPDALGGKNTGKFVQDAVLADAISRVAVANDGASITVYEILTAAMFILFSEQPADVVIIEVGLGGRFDATNVIENPAASVIMPVSMDHQSMLGNTPGEIAFEKAGIIKKQCTTIISQQPYDDALDVITAQAEKNKCPVTVFGQDFMGYEEHGRFVYQDDDGLLDLPLPALQGAHQYANAATAIKAVKEAGFALRTQAVEAAMGNVYWPGRLQKLPSGAIFDKAQEFANGVPVDILVDGGHNQDAAKVLVDTITHMNAKDKRPLYLICAMLNTKDPSAFFKPYQDHATLIVTVPITSSDAGIKASDLSDYVKEQDISTLAKLDITDALKAVFDHHAKTDLGSPLRILFCGSLYLVGDVLDQNGTPPQ